MRTLLLSLMLLAPAAFAQQPPPATQVHAIQKFVDGDGASCRTVPAQACIDAAWRFVAADPSEGLTLGDLQALRSGVGLWYDERQTELPRRERGSIGLGLVLADGIGVDHLHGAFDTDRDGLVTQQELLADVTLDQRPLGVVLADPKAVDRPALARRLGLPLAVLEGLFPR